ncbi:UNVERIFIED_CONTAM: hypothetical protein GTU68_024508 [Idotea baltica]|nr:hypothetical protein [Idotea baltica]
MLGISALAAGFLAPLKALVATAIGFQQAGSYLHRIDDVLESPREQEDKTVIPAPALAGEISLENVVFRYGPADPEVIRGVSLHVPAGAFVAVVGPSGAGKTSLAQVLTGLYPPTSGRVLFDGIDLDSLDLKSVRRQVGIVSQQPFLFNASIRHNIALIDPSMSLSRVTEAARLACIDADIQAQPMGYNTILADGGAGLSGGQRQRIALARALVRRPPILVLDEATSNLDAATEQAIHQQLERLDCTRVVIAHRLSTIRSADLILVMDAGRLVESGDHEGLMRHGGIYCRLVEAQLQKRGAGHSASVDDGPGSGRHVNHGIDP